MGLSTDGGLGPGRPSGAGARRAWPRPGARARARPRRPAARPDPGPDPELIGFPRHLSQHVGGFVMTRGPLCELVPIENAAMEDRTVIEWDKDDLDALGMLKVDVLALGMLTCCARASTCCAALRPRSRPGHRAGRGPGGLRHAVQGRLPRRVPGREPGPDDHAAAPQAAQLLRPGDRGGDRAPRADPGRHGPSLPAPPQRRGAGQLSLRGAARRCWARPWACPCSRSRP